MNSQATPHAAQAEIASNTTAAQWGASAAEWRAFQALGLSSDLLPVVCDPAAKISPQSKMKGKGKTPSKFNGAGDVVGIVGWTQHLSTDAEVKRWSNDSRLGICVQTRRVKAIDIDIADPVHAAEAQEFLELVLGRLPVRCRSNSGKRLLLLSLAVDFPKRVIKTAHGIIELLSTGQQFVAVGAHYGNDGQPSGARYAWPAGLPTVVPDTTMAELDVAWQALVEQFALPDGATTARNGMMPAVPRRADDLRDSTVAWLDENGWVTDYERDGRVDVRCPWEDGHSVDSGPSSTSYFPAGVGGFAQGHFRCLHASCSGRTDGDFLEAVGCVVSEFDTVDAVANASGEPEDTKVDFTDRGNVNLWAKLTCGNLRYLVEKRQWMLWTAVRWELDTTGGRAFATTALVSQHYAKLIAKLTAELSGLDSGAAKRHQKTIDALASWEKACRSRRGIDNMLALASKHQAFTISVEDIDTKPELLGVQNGVVNLRTGALHPDAREDLVTRRAVFAYRADAAAPRWAQFIAEVTGAPLAVSIDSETGAIDRSTVGRYEPRPLYANYMQRSLGYSSTGVTVEQKMHTAFGEGSNGKNVLFDTVSLVLGDYATPASPKLLLRGPERDADKPTPALFALKGSRLAVSSEPPANSTFDPSVLKALTGETQLTGRELNANMQRMRVTFHLWLLCNDKPRVEHLGPAVAGRILMLPFDRRWNRPGVAERDPTLPEPDKGLMAVLAGEGEGILAWLIAGAVDYFAHGLEPCAEVVEATRTYLRAQEADPVGEWLGEQETCLPQNGTQASVLFRAFESWRVAREGAGSLLAGSSPVTQTAFGLTLRHHKVASAKYGVIRYGVRLASDFEREDDARDEYARLLAKFGALA